LTWREVRQALHEELSRLPERYRAPLVLCCLEGLTQEAAAVQMRLPRSTFRERLERARALLRTRLVRRGLGPAAFLVVTAWPAAAASASVPMAVVLSTVKAATAIAAGRAAAGVVSAKVAALTEGVLKIMFLSKLKVATAGLLAIALAAAAVSIVTLPAPAAPQTVSVEGAATPEEARPEEGRPQEGRPPAQAKADAKPVVVREDAQVSTIAWSANGKLVATIGLVFETVNYTDSDGNQRGTVIPHSTIKLWNATTGELQRSLGEEKDTFIAAIAISADGKTAAISTSKHILTKDAETPFKFETEVRVLDAQTWAVKHTVKVFASALAFSPDGTRLALGGRSRLAEDAAFVRLWDVQKQKLVGGTEGGGHRVHCLAFSGDGEQLAAGDENGGVRLLDGLSGELRRAFEGHGPLRSGGAQCVTGVGFGPDGKTLVSGSMNKTLKLWDVEAGKLLGALEGSRGRVTALAFSRDGQLLATAGVGGEEGMLVEVLLWDAKTWKLMKAFPDQTMQVQSLAFSPDGNTLATGAGNPFNSGSATGDGRQKTPGELRLIPLEPVDATLDGEGVVAAAQAKEAAGEIQDALRKAVAFLKGTRANWEAPQSPNHVGGHTGLAVWALLEAGVATDDPAVAKGLDYLRTVEPESTYVVSLQTMVFCRAALKRDRELIKRNVDWLLAAMNKDKEGRFIGWSYTKRPSIISDNSNTQYAVMALDAAAKSDVEIDAAIWQQVKEYYLRVQLPDGGWAYTSRDPGSVSGSTQTMTSAGVTGLAICRHQLKEKAPAAIDRGLERLAELYDQSHPTAGYYFMHGLSRAAAASGQAKLENKAKGVSFDWKQDIRRRLLKAQASNGSWRSTHPWESHPPLATSFAVLVLSTMR